MSCQLLKCNETPYLCANAAYSRVIFIRFATTKTKTALNKCKQFAQRSTAGLMMILCESQAKENGKTMDPKLIDDLSKRFYKNLPDNVKHLGEDLKQNFSSVLESGLSKFNVVTREEFEIQKLVLAKCRKQINELKARLALKEEE